jgi:hypothetical protein
MEPIKDILLTILLIIILTGAISTLLFVLLYPLWQYGKKRLPSDDLIYLEMLIRNTIKEPLFKRNIESIITDYRSRLDIDKVKLAELDKLFRSKFSEAEIEITFNKK